MIRWFRRRRLRADLRATLEVRRDCIRELGSRSLTPRGREIVNRDIAWLDERAESLRRRLEELE